METGRVTPETLSRRLAAEALGTGLLVATVVGAPLYPRAVNCMIKIATERVGVNSASRRACPCEPAPRRGVTVGEVRDALGRSNVATRAPAGAPAQSGPPCSRSTKAYFGEEEGGPRGWRTLLTPP